MTITADTIIQETIDRYPDTAAVYTRYNLRCHQCGGNASDRIEDIAYNHGVDLAALLSDLYAVAAGE